MERRHAIIVIKKDNKYLQYYDTRWNSYLFLNCKVSDFDDYDKIKEEIYNKLNINDFEINYKFDKIHTKFSESESRDKEYHHYFYLVGSRDFNKFPDNEFMNNGVSFKWYSYDELLGDIRIQEVNSDIVSFIKDI